MDTKLKALSFLVQPNCNGFFYTKGSVRPLPENRLFLLKKSWICTSFLWIFTVIHLKFSYGQCKMRKTHCITGIAGTGTLYLIGTDKMWQLVDVADNQSLNIEAFEVVTPFRETPDGLPAATIEPFRQANQVLVSKSGTMALALAENPKHPEAKNYILLFTHPNGVVGPDDIINELFGKYDITYHQVTRECNRITFNRIELCLSHDERFVN